AAAGPAAGGAGEGFDPRAVCVRRAELAHGPRADAAKTRRTYNGGGCVGTIPARATVAGRSGAPASRRVRSICGGTGTDSGDRHATIPRAGTSGARSAGGMGGGVYAGAGAGAGADSRAAFRRSAVGLGRLFAGLA